jgi:hypothetical protein
MHICASILFSANNKYWLAEDGAAIHQALQKLVERRTVPQVFVNGVHVGGADGMSPLFCAACLTSLYLFYFPLSQCECITLSFGFFVQLSACS